MPDARKWSILTYIAAHNNLEGMGRDSYQQIVKVGSTNEVAHGILFDGHEGAARYIVGEPGTVSQQERLGAYDSGDAGSLIKTANWFFSQHRAERYGLVLWSHGNGWVPQEIETVAREVRAGAEFPEGESRERAVMPGSRILFRSTLSQMLSPSQPRERAVLFDDGTGHALDTLALGRVANAIQTTIGQPLDFLGMDACLMASLEVAYHLRTAVRCLVASEELVPGHSWPYDRIYGALRNAPMLAVQELSREVVESYTDFYRASPPKAGDVTQVGLDLQRIAEVAHGLDSLAAALLANIDSQADVLWKAQAATMKRETNQGARHDSKFDYHLWDLGTLSRELWTATKEPSVKGAALSLLENLSPGKGAIIAEGHCGSWFDGIAGVSVYLVRPPTRISPHYAKLALAENTRWGELLSAYHQVYA